MQFSQTLDLKKKDVVSVQVLNLVSFIPQTTGEIKWEESHNWLASIINLYRLFCLIDATFEFLKSLAVMGFIIQNPPKESLALPNRHRTRLLLQRAQRRAPSWLNFPQNLKSKISFVRYWIVTAWMQRVTTQDPPNC